MSRRSNFVFAIVAGVFGLSVFILTPSLSGGTPFVFTAATALSAMIAIIALLRARRTPQV